VKSCSLELKNIFIFGSEVFRQWRLDCGMYWGYFDDVIGRSNQLISWLKFYWKLVYNTSFWSSWSTF